MRVLITIPIITIACVHTRRACLVFLIKVLVVNYSPSTSMNCVKSPFKLSANRNPVFACVIQFILYFLTPDYMPTKRLFLIYKFSYGVQIFLCKWDGRKEAIHIKLHFEGSQPAAAAAVRQFSRRDLISTVKSFVRITIWPGM